MQLPIYSEFSSGVSRERKTSRLILTDRDFQIIEFLLDMKFSSLEEVFFKYFKVTKSNELAISDLWAKERLLQLEKARFIHSIKSFSENTRYFVVTFKGYYALSSFNPTKSYTKPLPRIDQRTFLHDKMVLKARVQLEEFEKVAYWLSDRKLKSHPELTQGLPNQYIPDGIYETADGKKVAFELEIAPKAKARYRLKIKKYVEIMRSKDESKKLFQKCLYVVAKKHVYEFLVKETKIYGDLFEIHKFEDFFRESSSLKAKTQI